MTIEHKVARAIHRASKRAQFYAFDDLHAEERDELLTEAVKLRDALIDEGLVLKRNPPIDSTEDPT